MTKVMVAQIFSIIGVIGWAIGFVYFFIYFALIAGLSDSCSHYHYCGTDPNLGIGVAFGLVFLALMIPSVTVLRRTGEMRGAARKSRLMELKRLNSIGWAIAGLFCAVVPGVMLLMANGPIDELGSLNAGGGLPSGSLGGVSEPKAVPNPDVITKEQSEAQVNPVVRPMADLPTGAYDELSKLKILYDSGALTSTEYADQKKRVLNGVQ
jgi:hypothetical protein